MGNYYGCKQTRKDWATYYEDATGKMDTQIRTTREAYTLFWHKNDDVKIPSAGSSSIIVMLFLHAYQIFPSFSANSRGFSAASLVLFKNYHPEQQLRKETRKPEWSTPTQYLC